MERNPDAGHHYFTQHRHKVGSIPTACAFIVKITRAFFDKCRNNNKTTATWDDRQEGLCGMRAKHYPIQENPHWWKSYSHTRTYLHIHVHTSNKTRWYGCFLRRSLNLVVSFAPKLNHIGTILETRKNKFCCNVWYM